MSALPVPDPRAAILEELRRQLGEAEQLVARMSRLEAGVFSATHAWVAATVAGPLLITTGAPTPRASMVVTAGPCEDSTCTFFPLNATLPYVPGAAQISVGVANGAALMASWMERWSSGTRTSSSEPSQSVSAKSQRAGAPG